MTSSTLSAPAAYARAHSESSALSPRPEEAVMFTNTRRRGIPLSSDAFSPVLPSRTSSATIELPQTGHLSCTNPDLVTRHPVLQAPHLLHTMSTEKDLPRLPIPDFGNAFRRPFQQALAAPMNYFWGRSTSKGGAVTNRHAEQDTTGRESESRVYPSSASRSNSGSVKRSNTSNTSKASPSRASSSRQPYYLQNGHRSRSGLSDEEDELDEVMSAYLDLPVLDDNLNRLPTRRPTLTSPDPNNYHQWLTSEKPTTFETLIPMLQLTSARFTQKFPETAVRKVEASMDGTGGTYGVEGLQRWTIHKWVLMFSVITVRCGSVNNDPALTAKTPPAGVRDGFGWIISCLEHVVYRQALSLFHYSAP
ncbi:hypothetical protein FRB96_003659 [Tulasnella sp. 330]|nr:hypothetical protein FRB96_003659 [Tulasnella sp. 330]